MATKLEVDIQQKREAYVDGVTTKCRVTTRITDVRITKDSDPSMTPDLLIPPDPDAGRPPYNNFNNANSIQNCFLMKKYDPESPEPLVSSKFMRLVQPEDLQPENVEDALLGIDDTTWEEMLKAGQISQYKTSDTNLQDTLASSDCTRHSYYLSSILVRDYDSVDTAENEASNLILALRAMVSRFNKSFNAFSSVDDSITYPTGWEETSFS